jgi:hypothetical protein
MFHLAGFVVLMFATSAFAQSSVVDWSKPQTDGFRSIVDLRGDSNLRPQDGNPVRKAERPAPPADPSQQAMALANTGDARTGEASAPAYAHGAPRSGGPRVGVYLDLSHRNAATSGQASKAETAARSHKRSAPSFRLGRRR